MRLLKLLVEEIDSNQQERIDLSVAELNKRLALAKVGYMEASSNIIGQFIDDLKCRAVYPQYWVYALESQKETIIAYLRSLLSIRTPYFFVSRLIKNVSALKDALPDLWPEVTEIIEAGKTMFLKKILMNVKDLTTYPAEETIQDLRELNIKWPELDMIQKSIDASKQEITEAINKKDRNTKYIKEILDDLKYFATVSPKVAGIKSSMQLLKDEGLTPSEIKAALTRLKRPILNFLEVMIHNSGRDFGDLPSWLDLILVLTEYGNVSWVELPAILESKKSIIIKILLHAMKQNDLGSVNYTLEHLAKLNIHWSELDTIKKSVEFEFSNRKKRRLGESESDDEDNFKDAVLWYVNNIVQDIEHVIELGVYDGNLIENNARFLIQLPRNMSDENIKNIFEKYKETILNYLTYLTNMEEPNFVVKYAATNAYWLLKLVKWPEVYKILESAKPKLIRLLLTNIKNGKYRTAKETIFLLKNQLNLKWHELDLIKKSLDAESNRYQIGEDINDERSEAKQGMINNVIKHMLNDMSADQSRLITDSDLFRYIIRKLKRSELNDNDIAELFEPHKVEILKYLSYYLSIDKTVHLLGNAHSMQYIMNNLVQNAYWLLKVVQWPEIYKILEDAKPNLVKLMLINIQHEKYTAAKGLTFLLKYQLHINWPELDIIDRSIRIELANKGELDEDTESRREASSKLAKSNTIIKNMLKEMQRIQSRKQTNYDLFDRVRYRLLVEVGLHQNDAIKLLEPHKDEILKFLNYYISSPIIEDSYDYTAEVIIHNLIYLHDLCKWPELHDIAETAKPRIIRYLLVLTKEGIYKDAKRLISLLRQYLFLNWPELNTIDKSLDTLYESTNSIEDDIAKLQQKFDDRQYNLAVSDIGWYNLTVNKHPWLNELLNKYKIQILNWLLQIIKDNLSSVHINNFDDSALRYVDALIKSEVDWPELTVIKNSLSEPLTKFRRRWGK